MQSGCFETAWGAAQDQAGRHGPWLWQGWPCGAAAAEGGRRVNPLEGTPHDQVVRPRLAVSPAVALLVRARVRVGVRVRVRVGVTVRVRVRVR